MRVFPSLPGKPELSTEFGRFPRTAVPLFEYHHRLPCHPSPLTVAERELIAAYVPGLNARASRHGAHRVAAEEKAARRARMANPVDDPRSAPSPYLRPTHRAPGAVAMTRT